MPQSAESQRFHTLDRVPDALRQLPVLSSARIADFPPADQTVYQGMNMAELWRFAKKGNKAPGKPECTLEEQVAAAIAFLEKHFDKDAIGEELANRLVALHPKKGAVITLLAPAGALQQTAGGTMATSRNVLPTVHACAIKEALEEAINRHLELVNKDLRVEINEQFVQLSKSNSTDAGIIGKIVSTPYFALANEHGEIIALKEKQDKIALVVEDDTEMGGAVLAAQAFAGETFTHSIGVAVVATSPGAKCLAMQDETRNALQGKLGEDDMSRLDVILGKTGQSVESISNIAGIALFALLSDPEDAKDCVLYDQLLKNADTSRQEIQSYEKVRGGKQHLLTEAFENRAWCGLSSRQEILQKFDTSAAFTLGSRTMLSPLVTRISYVERIRQNRAEYDQQIPSR